MALNITQKENDIIGCLFGAYINLQLDYNDTINMKFHYPKFSNFTDRITKIKSHIKNLEELACELGYDLYVEKEPKSLPKVTSAFFKIDGKVYVVFDFLKQELFVDRQLL